MADANLSGNENRGINNEPVNNKLTKLTTQYTGHYKYATVVLVLFTIMLRKRFKIKLIANLIY